MKKKTQFDLFVDQLKQQAKLHTTPLFGHFELTARCNLDCKMCYVHEQDSPEIRKRELATAQWLKIMDDAYEAGMLFALLTGGECLLRRDFKEIYLHLWRKGVHVSINTNAVMLTGEYLEFFKTYRPHKFQISLYGSCEEAYSKVTGQRVFSRVAESLRRLQEESFSFTVAVTPSKFLQDDFANIIRYLRDHKIKHVVNPATLPPREGLERDDYTLTEDEYFELLHQQYDICGIKRTPIAIDTLPPAGGCGTSERGSLICNAGLINFSVNWQGQMLPCLALPSYSVNLLETGFSPAWEQIKRLAQENLIPLECNGCIYAPVCIHCPAERLSEDQPGHCNESLCNRTRRKCAEGFVKLPKSTAV